MGVLQDRIAGGQAIGIQPAVTLTGAATGSAPLSEEIPVTLASTGVVPGTYGSSTGIPVLTVNPAGQITAIGESTAASGSGTVTSVTSANSDLTVSNPNSAPVLTVVSAPKWDTARTLSFTGDATGSGSVDGSANVATALTLATSGVTAGTYGDSTHVAQVTVDAKGRLTAVANVAISGGGGGVTSITFDPTWMTGGTITTTGNNNMSDAAVDALAMANHKLYGGI